MTSPSTIALLASSLGHQALRFLALTGVALAAIFTAIPASADESAPGEQTYVVNNETGRETWSIREHGVSLSLSQILPDQARAFYSNRGFRSADSELFANACVFMTVLRNDGEAGADAIEYQLSDWQVNGAGHSQAPLSIDHWLAVWERREVKKPQRIAFRWAQFPPAQRYQPGDWNQGMLSTGLPPGSAFDLTAKWRAGDRLYATTLQGVHCAK